MFSKEDLLELVLRVARVAGVKTSIGGGIAVYAHGFRRDTADVDAFFHFEDRLKVLRALRKIQDDDLSQDFVLEELHPSHWTLTQLGSPPDERVDLLFASGDPEESAVEMSVPKTYHKIKIPVFPVDLLVISKLLAEREGAKDALDIYELHRKGAFEVSEVATRLRQMGFDEDAQRFPEFMNYLNALSTKRRR